MKNLAPILILLLLTAAPVRAQYSTEISPYSFIAPAALIATGTGIHFLAHDGVEVPLRGWIQDDLRAGAAYHSIGAYTAGVNMVAFCGLGLVGVPSRHAFFDRCMEGILTAVIGMGVTYSTKALIHSVRPDGDGFDSFPSSHTMAAFAGAQLMSLEYGLGWGIGAYSLATFTAADRMWGDRHWLGDVLAGAGVGVLSACLAAYLLEPVKSALQLPDLNWDGFKTTAATLALMPGIDPFSGTPMACAALKF